MTGMPSYPTGPEPTTPQGRLPQVAAPAEVLLSVRLWFASILAGLLGGILVFVLTDRSAAVQTMMDADTSGLSRSAVQTAVTVGIIVGFGFAVIMLALEVLFVLKLKAGRNWARIVLTVLAGVSTISSLAGLTKTFSVGTAVNLVSLVLVLAAVVLMFRPAANPYFRRPKV